MIYFWTDITYVYTTSIYMCTEICHQTFFQIQYIISNIIMSVLVSSKSMIISVTWCAKEFLQIMHQGLMESTWTDIYL